MGERNGRGVTLHRTYILRHPFSGPLKLKTTTVMQMFFTPEPERPTGKKKEYLLVRSPRARVQSQGQLNHFAAVRFTTIYQVSVTRLQPSRLGLDTKKKFNPAERPDVHYLSRYRFQRFNVCICVGG